MPPTPETNQLTFTKRAWYVIAALFIVSIIIILWATPVPAPFFPVNINFEEQAVEIRLDDPYHFEMRTVIINGQYRIYPFRHNQFVGTIEISGRAVTAETFTRPVYLVPWLGSDGINRGGLFFPGRFPSGNIFGHIFVERRFSNPVISLFDWHGMYIVPGATTREEALQRVKEIWEGAIVYQDIPPT